MNPSSGASPGGGLVGCVGCVVAAGGFCGGEGAWACAAAHVTVAANNHALAEIKDYST
jgi:hypothetical protein